MKKIRYHKGLIVMMAIVLVALFGCTKVERKKANVMVVFSYDENHLPYVEYLEKAQETFLHGGYDVDLRAVYMDMENGKQDFKKKLQAFKDSVDKDHWVPDVMIFEGDRPARTLICAPYDSIFDFNHTPIILGAMHHFSSWENLNGHTNLVRWSDPMDFCTNIDLAVSLMGKNEVQIELDFGSQDSLLRQELSKQIARPPYIDNSDLHLEYFSTTRRKYLPKDSIVVSVYSVEHPERNGTEVLHDIMTYAWKYPTLVVKKDIYAEMIARKTDQPQFSAIRGTFNDGTGHYLAGYFASYATIAEDCCGSAIEILNGKPLNQMDVREHTKQKWMDYKAMQRLGWNYDDYKDEFQIVNAPYEVANRDTYWTMIGVYICLGLLVLAIIIWIMLRIRHRIIRRDRKRLEHSINMSRLCLQGANSYMLQSEEDIQRYVERIADSHADEAAAIIRASQTPGEYQFQVLGDMEEKGTNVWWEFRFIVRGKNDVNGLVLNVNERKVQKEQMEQAILNRQETMKKENFMMKTSREISTPLNAIQDYCTKLTNGAVTPSEKRRLSEAIAKHSENLTAIISDILLFSRIESRRQQYFMKDVLLKPFMDSVYKHWKERIPANLEFQYVTGRVTARAFADEDRLRDILDQFLSNAIKFTDMGFIALGWRYHLSTQEVELFVEDSGVGISENKQKVAFSLFWKENDFMPGVGLGLNIAKRLAENMGGHITISSKEGVGSRFSIWVKAKG